MTGQEEGSVFEGLGKEKGWWNFLRIWMARSLKGKRVSGEAAVEEDKEEGSVDRPRDAHALMVNVRHFWRLSVKDVMVPRVDIVAMDERSTLGDCLRLFESSEHSRIPTYREKLDAPTGMVHIKDVVTYVMREAKRQRKKTAVRVPVRIGGRGTALPPDLGLVDLSRTLHMAELVRRVMFVPSSMRASELFLQMQEHRIHLVLVVDEYGGTEGLVSIEDLVEVIVGEIEDEHDLVPTERKERERDGSYVVDGRMSIEDFAEMTGNRILQPEGGDVDTLGGLILSLLGRVPLRGEVVECGEGVECEILSVDARKIKKLRIRGVPLCGMDGDGAKADPLKDGRKEYRGDIEEEE